jgi:hypothetical protein
LTYRVQVQAKDLDKDSFWVKVHEDELASDDLFAALKDSFAVKAARMYHMFRHC